MKHITILLLFSFCAVAQESDVKESDSALGFIECQVDPNYKSVSDLVAKLKAGEEIMPEDLVNNPNFLNPCFAEKAGNYQKSFNSLKQLADSVVAYKNSEKTTIERTNDINAALGTKRDKPVPKKTSAAKDQKPKVYRQTKTKAFTNFKKNVKLIGTTKNESDYWAMVEVNGLPINDLKVGQLLAGVEIIEIGYGFIKYRDQGADKKSDVLRVGGK